MANVLDQATKDLAKGESVNQDLKDFSQFLRNRSADSGASGNSAPRNDTKQRDPYVHLRFAVQIDQVDVALFSECSALTIENEVFEYQEGGLNTYVHKLPTRTKYGNVTLKRGVDDSQQLHTWFMQIATDRIKRQNVSIILYDATGKEVRRWDLQNAYPCTWTGPDLKTDAGAVAVETVELAHEGLIPRGSSAPAGAEAALSALASNVQAGASAAANMVSDAAHPVLDGVDEMTKVFDKVDEYAKGAIKRVKDVI